MESVSKGTEIILRMVLIFAVFMILLTVYLGLTDKIENWDVAAFWFIGSCVAIFFVSKKLRKPMRESQTDEQPSSNKLLSVVLAAYNQPKDKSTTIGIVAAGLGVASVVVPYFAAVFFVPAALICGIVAIRQGDKKFGGIAVILAIVGLVGV